MNGQLSKCPGGGRGKAVNDGAANVGAYQGHHWQDIDGRGSGEGEDGLRVDGGGVGLGSRGEGG